MAIDQAERATRIRVLFREVNQRVVELEQCGFQETNGDGSTVRAVCECADVRCHAPIELSIGAYEAIRASPLRFLVRPGHERPELERVVSEDGDYTVARRRPEPRGVPFMTDWSADDGGHPEDVETLIGLRETLEARTEAGDPLARIHLQVVVAFIAELEGRGLAGPVVERQH